ncbi:MAG: hypothetical protein Q7R81_05905 [Candidatus Peregrinibacteria bacterium]|nr:hypothetical protein [Candidatus Peregrinibacteria bacterium]
MQTTLLSFSVALLTLCPAIAHGAAPNGFVQTVDSAFVTAEHSLSRFPDGPARDSAETKVKASHDIAMNSIRNLK